MEDISSEQARSALDLTERARSQVADEVGVPRGYWWAMAAGWLMLGAIGDLAPPWLVTAAMIVFGAGHAVAASRLLDGRRRTRGLRVSTAVAGRRTPVIVVGLLIGMVAVTIGLGYALHADGAHHSGVWAALPVAAIIGLGGPEILTLLRGKIRG